MPRTLRQSQNREIFRQVNERAAAVSERFLLDSQPLEFFCECVTAGCDRQLGVSLGVYARVRESEGEYLVAAGHDDVEHEAVLERHGDYLIVRVREARRAARDARESAAALRAQAELQVRRATRNEKK